jgi:putative flippase GtrA
MFRYLISGGTAAFVDLFLLHIFDAYFGFHYLISVNLAFIIAFFVSFSMQKHWTFKDSNNKDVKKQIIKYFIVSIINVFINSIFISLLLHINIIPELPIIRPLVAAQIIASIIIAFESFVIYRFFIFNRNKDIDNKPLKILIITQKVDKDDPILGFFHGWIIEFAKNFEYVTVVCLEKGKYDLPENVKVLSLGKEERQSRLQYIIHFYFHIIYERKNYDAVFVHMNQIYVVMGGIFWRLWKKKIILWYTHKAISMSLRLATILTHKVFTASKESFRLKSKKVIVMGHGIDIKLFYPKKDISRFNIINIITVSRISRSKDF